MAIDDGEVYTVNTVFTIDGGYLVAFAPQSTEPMASGVFELPRLPNSPPPD